jgi:hypothetical protein
MRRLLDTAAILRLRGQQTDSAPRWNTPATSRRNEPV